MQTPVDRPPDPLVHPTPTPALPPRPTPLPSRADDIGGGATQQLLREIEVMLDETINPPPEGAAEERRTAAETSDWYLSYSDDRPTSRAVRTPRLRQRAALRSIGSRHDLEPAGDILQIRASGQRFASSAGPTPGPRADPTQEPRADSTQGPRADPTNGPQEAGWRRAAPRVVPPWLAVPAVPGRHVRYGGCSPHVTGATYSSELEQYARHQSKANEYLHKGQGHGVEGQWVTSMDGTAGTELYRLDRRK